MRTVKVTFEDGNSLVTSINGTKSNIQDYYKIGNTFNLGTDLDNLQKVKTLEFLD